MKRGREMKRGRSLNTGRNPPIASDQINLDGDNHLIALRLCELVTVRCRLSNLLEKVPLNRSKSVKIGHEPRY
jgi:hypothetical protein